MSGKTWLSDNLQQLCCARVPRAALPQLASLRTISDIEVLLQDDCAWIHWQPGDWDTLRCIWPVSGARLYSNRDGLWFEHGKMLPDFNMPQDNFRPISHVLTPQWQTEAPAQDTSMGDCSAGAGHLAGASSSPISDRVHLSLASDVQPRPATAMCCDVHTLLRWADTVPTHRLSRLQAVRKRGQLLVRGPRLPLLTDCRRYHGDSVLIPLGYCAEPNLPEAELRRAAGVDQDDVLLLDEQAFEIIAQQAFAPLSRAGLRACAEARP